MDGNDELDSTVAAALRVIAHAAQHLDTDDASAARHVTGAEAAREMIDALERAVSHAPRQASQREVLLTLRAARAEMLSAELARQRSMITRVTRQISRIRMARTLDDFVASVPIETSGLGYERVMFSWVEKECWVPRSSHTVSGPHEAQAMLAAGGPPYHPVRDLNEVEVVRGRKPILVLDALSNSRVHPTITPISRSVTYVAAPVVAQDRVVAMVHADRNVDTGVNDEFDRDLLAMFCENIGVALDRLMSASAEVDLPTSVHGHRLEALTEREREVLRLVALGLTNAQIGARLYISEETTKTHVKKLMRKLGVTNRSQAGAIFHQLSSTSR